MIRGQSIRQYAAPMILTAIIVGNAGVAIVGVLREMAARFAVGSHVTGPGINLVEQLAIFSLLLAVIFVTLFVIPIVWNHGLRSAGWRT